MVSVNSTVISAISQCTYFLDTQNGLFEGTLFLSSIESEKIIKTPENWIMAFLKHALCRSTTSFFLVSFEKLTGSNKFPKSS